MSCALLAGVTPAQRQRDAVTLLELDGRAGGGCLSLTDLELTELRRPCAPDDPGGLLDRIALVVHPPVLVLDHAVV